MSANTNGADCLTASDARGSGFSIGSGNSVVGGVGTGIAEISRAALSSNGVTNVGAFGAGGGDG